MRLQGDVDRFLARSAAGGVRCERPVAIPLHRLLRREGYPGTETAHREAVSIPLYPSLTADEADRVIEVVSMELKEAS